jgi:GT2 family glycosyltransferase
MKYKIDTSVIIVNYNGFRDTINCISSLSDSEYKNMHIIIVDNCSTDNSYNELAEWLSINYWNWIRTSSENAIPSNNESLRTLISKQKSSIILIKSDKNNGFAAGNNIGINFAQKHLNTEYFWLLNNDTQVAFDSVKILRNKMIEERGKQRKLGLLGAKILDYTNRNIIQSVGVKYNKFLAVAKPIGSGEKDIGQFDADGPFGDYILGASLFFHSSFIEEVGLMSEKYFLYFEELDWILRGKKRDGLLGMNHPARFIIYKVQALGLILQAEISYWTIIKFVTGFCLQKVSTLYAFLE